MRNAILSEDRVYRYTLARVWDADAGVVAFVGLNPSTADEKQDDNTIRRCVAYARDWGHGGIVMLNLFAYRATDPHELVGAADPVGEHNDLFLETQAAQARLVVACWGVWGQIRGRARQVIDSGVLGDWKALSLTKDGHPGHPLYLKKALRPRDPRVLEALR